MAKSQGNKKVLCSGPCGHVVASPWGILCPPGHVLRWTESRMNEDQIPQQATASNTWGGKPKQGGQRRAPRREWRSLMHLLRGKRRQQHQQTQATSNIQFAWFMDAPDYLVLTHYLILLANNQRSSLTWSLECRSRTCDKTSTAVMLCLGGVSVLVICWCFVALRYMLMVPFHRNNEQPSHVNAATLRNRPTLAHRRAATENRAAIGEVRRGANGDAERSAPVSLKRKGIFHKPAEMEHENGARTNGVLAGDGFCEKNRSFEETVEADSSPPPPKSSRLA